MLAVTVPVGCRVVIEVLAPVAEAGGSGAADSGLAGVPAGRLRLVPSQPAPRPAPPPVPPPVPQPVPPGEAPGARP
ncbi:hypothetical protein [Geodermatophilus sp. SYSU D00700]